MEAEDTIATWIAACCETSRYNAEGSSVLYGSYKAWAVAANEDAMSHKRFSQALAARGYSARKVRWADEGRGHPACRPTLLS